MVSTSDGPIRITERRRVLPDGVLPRGLSRVEAAAYIGVSPTTFDRLIADKLMPGPIRIYGRTVWDIRKLDAAFSALDKSDEIDDVWSRMAL
jgi:predicted DNA-binding transcriptional regulator AlpA